MSQLPQGAFTFNRSYSTPDEAAPVSNAVFALAAVESGLDVASFSITIPVQDITFSLAALESTTKDAASFALTTTTAGGGTVSTAIPGVTFLVPGTSLITNPRTGKPITHDYEVGWIKPGTSRAGTQAEAASSLQNVSTGSLPSGLRFDGQHVWADVANQSYSNLYFPPGTEFVPNAANITLNNSFLYQARINPQSNKLTVNNVSIYNPRTGAYFWDDMIKEGGDLTLYRVAIIHATGDALKAHQLRSMRQCVIVGAGDHGDMMQYAPLLSSQTCIVEENYFNQCTTATGETSVWRSESAYGGTITFRTNVLVVDNINAIQMNNGGAGGTFTATGNFFMKETDDAGVQYTGNVLYGDTSTRPENTINNNPLLERDASTDSGYRWNGAYLTETAPV